jgi:hypothetical protein
LLLALLLGYLLLSLAGSPAACCALALCTTGTGTCRADLRLPDRDAAAAYDSDHTVELASVVPAPDVGFRTTHVDQYGITRAGKHHERRRVDAPWAFTGDRTRLAVRQ